MSLEVRARTEGAKADEGGRGGEHEGGDCGGAVTAYLHPLDHGKQVRGLRKRVDTKSKKKKKKDKRVRQFTAASAHLSSPLNWRAACAAQEPRKD